MRRVIEKGGTIRLGVREAVVDDEIVAGDVIVEDGVVTAVGIGPPGRRGMAVPGFVDVQVNGFAGVDFLAADADGYATAGTALVATGVTAYQPTFISSPLEVYRTALDVASRLPDRPGGPRILGIHLEGPFISKAWAGAHDPGQIRDVDLDLARRLCAAGPVRYMTLAPELDGAVELIHLLVDHGVVVACGHSDADAEAAHAAFDAGARAVTHVFNAHRRFAAREPGLAGVALSRSDVVVQAIVDHHHLAKETTSLIASASRERFALVTDSIAATGLGDGTYRLGTRQVQVSDGAPRVEGGTLAGSTLTMDRAIRNLLELGIAVTDAVRAATSVPAGLLGRDDLGTLTPGSVADVVILGDTMEVVRTIVAGDEVFSR